MSGQPQGSPMNRLVIEVDGRQRVTVRAPTSATDT